jgi:hypothetical protein
VKKRIKRTYSVLFYVREYMDKTIAKPGAAKQHTGRGKARNSGWARTVRMQ